MSLYFKIRKDYKDLVNDKISISRLENYIKSYTDVGIDGCSTRYKLRLIGIISVVVYTIIVSLIVGFFIKYSNMEPVFGVIYPIHIALIIIISIFVFWSKICKLFLSEINIKKYNMIDEIKSYYWYNRIVIDDKGDYLFIYNLLDDKNNLKKQVYKFIDRGYCFNKLDFLSNISSKYSNLDMRLEHYKNSKGKRIFRSYEEFNNKMIEIENIFNEIKLKLDKKKEQENKIKMLKLDIEEYKLDKGLEEFLNNN